MIVWRNAAHCNICDTTIESVHRHDFKRCKCADDETAVWVDGGHAYNRRMFGSRADYVDIREEFVMQGPVFLEHSNVRMRGVHQPGQCTGESCTIHNRSNHSKRSWVQHWNSKKGIMERISPTSGRHYRDPDEPIDIRAKKA